MTNDNKPLCYFDAGAWNSWDFVDYATTPPTLKMAELNNYISTLSSQLKNAKLDKITFSFAQLCDLQKIERGDLENCSHTDSLWMLYKNSDGAFTKSTHLNILQYVMSQLKANDIIPILSFGGAAATEEDFIFGFDYKNYTPSDAVNEVMTIINLYSVGGLDFDFETASMNMVYDNGAANLANFFKQLHAKAGIPITYTVMGQVSLWGTGGSVFKEMFSQGVSFADMFDGVNLMLYNGQYYIDAQNSSWGIELWMQDLANQIGCPVAETAQYIHIGYNDSLDYTNPTSSAGTKYDIPSDLSNGSAAAWIQNEVQEELRTILSDSTLTLNAPIFWEGKANYGRGPDGISLFITDEDSFQQQFLSWQPDFATV
ncbi:MAG: hypothetical protein P0S95_07530 [Rhabdochlamydiaceae bacterium]|nr:hypothetical protein [Candidatus Amphrikana amoebophyrae]